mmetsp:Transcript_1774/g.4061  ORF Transcript_1774/g.4061 Transcript_1774/m.4061 type:complete len:256 (-) Transcript_1774:539-1306(-)
MAPLRVVRLLRCSRGVFRCRIGLSSCWVGSDGRWAVDHGWRLGSRWSRGFEAAGTGRQESRQAQSPEHRRRAPASWRRRERARRRVHAAASCSAAREPGGRQLAAQHGSSRQRCVGMAVYDAAARGGGAAKCAHGQAAARSASGCAGAGFRGRNSVASRRGLRDVRASCARGGCGLDDVSLSPSAAAAGQSPVHGQLEPCGLGRCCARLARHSERRAGRAGAESRRVQAGHALGVVSSPWSVLALRPSDRRCNRG